MGQLLGILVAVERLMLLVVFAGVFQVLGRSLSVHVTVGASLLSLLGIFWLPVRGRGAKHEPTEEDERRYNDFPLLHEASDKKTAIACPGLFVQFIQQFPTAYPEFAGAIAPQAAGLSQLTQRALLYLKDVNRHVEAASGMAESKRFGIRV